MSTKSKRQFVLLLSDPHFGGRFALCPRGVVLPPVDDAGEDRPVVLTSTQEQLAEWWEKDLEEVKAYIGRREAALFVMGDIIHGPHELFGGETVSHVLDDQLAIAEAALAPIVAWPCIKNALLIKGTARHVGAGGSAEATLARALSRRGAKVRAWYHAEADYAGMKWDLAHHGPHPGRRTWLRGNELRLYLRSLVMDDLLAQRTPPDVVVRGHFHQHTLEHISTRFNGQHVFTWGAICPPYCLGAGDYTRKVTRSVRRSSVGILLAEIADGRILEWHEKWVHTVDLARKLVLR